MNALLDQGASLGRVEADGGLESRLIVGRHFMDSTCLGRPSQGLCFGIKLPTANAGNDAGLLQKFLTFPQVLLDEPACRDVLKCPDETG